MKYTLEEKMFMYKKYMSLGSPTHVQSAWRIKYVWGTAPSWSIIMMTSKKFEKTGSVINLQSRKKKILVQNLKMPKYPRKSHVRKSFTIDQKS
jgi:hypothetical protein